MTHSDAATAVQNAIEPWTQACLNRDWDALLSMCNDDIVFMPPGGPPVAGEAVRPWLEALPVFRTMEWSVDDLHEHGDVAYLRGPVRQLFEIDDQVEEFDGKYCDVMVKGADGQWRFSVVIWNANAE